MKKKYEPPLAVNFSSELKDAFMAVCTTGSNAQTGRCSSGGSASGQCTPGTSATGGVCRNGNSANGNCTAGTRASNTCRAGGRPNQPI